MKIGLDSVNTVLAALLIILSNCVCDFCYGFTFFCQAEKTGLKCPSKKILPFVPKEVGRYTYAPRKKLFPGRNFV